MRHSHTEPEMETMKSRSDSWNPDLAEPQVEGDDGPQQRGRMARASSQGDASAWQEIRSRFVDDPKGAIAAAEQLVQHVVDERVRALQSEASAICARERDDEDGDDASTEGMRTRLLRYQEYCERLSGSPLH